MAIRNEKTGGSIGASIGKAAAKAAKPKSAGRSVGRAVARTVKPKSTSSRRATSSRGSSSSGGRSSGGGGGGGRSVGSSVSKAAPKIPSLASYLGTDSVYQSALSGGKRTLGDYLSELSRRRGEAGTQFTQTQSNMERDRVQQLEDLKNEFASRGLIQSGLYGEEQGRFQEQFSQQSQALEQQQAALLADLLSQEKNYRRENDLAAEAARQEALARRAAKYNIGA